MSTQLLLRFMGDPPPLYGTPLKRSGGRSRTARRKPKRRKIKKLADTVTDRRLGLWRKQIDEETGQKRAVYVSLSGEVHRSLGQALRAQSEDSRLLEGDGMWGINDVVMAPVRRGRDGKGLQIPSLGTNRLSLSFWGLPESLVKSYAVNAKIESLFEWQADCLERFTKEEISMKSSNPAETASSDPQTVGSPSFFQIYTAPTSGGKSLVAEILLLRRLLYSGRRALFVVPFVAICREKCNYFKRVWGAAGIHVQEFHGGATEAWVEGVDVAVCTAEKANALLNRILISGGGTVGCQVDGGQICPFPENLEIGTIVIDEFHSVVTDESRGHLIEGLMVKLKLLRNIQERAGQVRGISMIAMSATLPDLPILGDWLDAEVFSGNFRPVNLQFSVKLGKRIFSIGSQGAGGDGVAGSLPFREMHACNSEDPEGLGELIRETDGSVIVFCASKKWCQTCAGMLARVGVGNCENESLSVQGRSQLVAALRLTPGGSSSVSVDFEKMLMAGVGYHHAGLTVEQRTIVETGFRAKHLKVLCATTTLSAGVNLPCKRVVLRSVGVLFPGGGEGSFSLARERLLQMAGRAGRTGFDVSGDAVVLVKDVKEAEWVRSLLGVGGRDRRSEGKEISRFSDSTTCSQRPVIGSMFKGSKAGKLLLECVGTGLLRNSEEISRFFLPALLSPAAFPDSAVQSMLSYLSENRLLLIGTGACKVEQAAELEGCIPDKKESQILSLTPLGEAVAFCAMQPEEAANVFVELRSAARCLRLEGNDFQVVLLSVPPSAPGLIGNDLDVWGLINAEMGSSVIGRVLRVEISRVRQSQKTEPGTSALLAKRIFCALILHELQTSDIAAVSRKFLLPLGTLQTLQGSSASFCGMLISFCERLRLWSLASAFRSVLPRLQFGVGAHLVALSQVPEVFPGRARALYEGGVESVEALANSDPVHIAMIFGKIAPVEGGALTAQLWELRKAAMRAVRGAKEILRGRGEMGG